MLMCLAGAHNRSSNSPLCKQCGPLLGLIEEISELEGGSEHKASLGDELRVTCASDDELSTVDGNEGTMGRSLRPEAPVFVPRAKYDEISEETEGSEAGTISVETDRLIGLLTKQAHLSVP